MAVTPVSPPRRRSSPTGVDLAAYAADLRHLALESGLDAVGIADAGPWPDALARMEQRRDDGFVGDMGFTYRDPARATEPRRSLPDGAALLVGALAYRRRLPDPDPEQHGPTAKVAAYAWVEHYEPLRRALKVVARRLKDDGWRARVLIDDNGLVDREAAHRAGLGWFGKNANLLLPGQGSWFVLGSVLTDAPLPANEHMQPDGCGTCRRCLDGCPTGAIVAPGVVDATRCLSWLLQVDGDFPEEHRAALGDRVYGCDDCQEVCPPNRRLESTAPAAEADARPRVDVLDLLAADDATLLGRHGRWYLPRRDPDHLRRNALVVLGNSGAGADPRVVATVERYRRHRNPVLRRHAEWAASRLAR